MTWTTDYCRNTAKSGQKSKDQLKAPSIKWLWTWKHSGMVDRTFRRGIHFTQTPLHCKSKDLDYKLLEGDYKKAIMSQRSAQSTINKLAKDLEAPRNGR
jgi:hypothetical protein